MELRHLRYFDILCQELHFARAAERLHIAQPALSIQIKNLEQELGTRLLARTRRKVELTHSGQLFLAEARKVLAQASKAIDTARRAERGELGRITIDFTRHSAHAGVLSAWLSVFNKRFAGVELLLREVSPIAQFDGLADGTADVAFVTTFEDVGALGLSIRRLAEISMVVAIPVSHPLSRRKRVDVKSLRSEPFVALNVREALPVLDVLGFTPKVVQSVASEAALFNLVASGLGLAIVPQTASTYNMSESLKFRPLEPPGPQICVGLAFRAGVLEPVVNAFLSCTPEI
ncbi:LysR substrate-binding domain-containing protein [Bradyrhizobium mercantei]|uniref:LysR substrate-binding domain-containing protein n=1 Tax=Bradyrhizobium mercantei TaxID=1904807 RepID=UPI000978B378|nr:LysR substrate-binding domain-containing protein [Bradyrhizobium mercantei]